MPKQTETRDRFKITAEVESEALGPLLAQLARMGLQNMGYELITDVVRFRSGGAKHDVSASDAIRAWLSDHPAFAVAQMTEQLATGGRSVPSLRQALRALVESGEVARLEPGHYRRIDKQLAPPVAETPAPEKKRTRVDGRRVYREVNNWDFTAGLLKGRKKITMTEIRQAFADDGRNPHSASPTVTGLRKQGFVKSIRDGEYEVVKGAVPRKPPPTPADRKEKDRLRAQARRDRQKAERLNGAGAAHE